MEQSLKSNVIAFPEYAKFKGMPDTLHIIGDLPENMESRSLGIVGSRRVSSYGIRVLRELFYFLKDTGVVVISGFTTGTDTYAHELAIEIGCKTVAILPCGCDVIHPCENYPLYKKLVKGDGAVLSEFEDGFSPQKWTYPKRNRLIAALSRVLLVVEASLNSGSMITAHFAFKYSKKTFCVPGDVFTERSMGTNMLISEGAEIYLSPGALLRELGTEKIQTVTINKNTVFSRICTESGRVLGILKESSCTFDGLLKELHASPVMLNVLLTEMMLRNEISEKNGMYYVL